MFNPELKQKYIYTLPRCVTINTILRIFQYKLLQNILSKQNANAPQIWKKDIPFLVFCMEEPESPIHLFHHYTKTNFLWMQLQHSFQNVLIIPPIAPQNTIFGFTDHKVNYHLINHILLVFKYDVYKTKENGSLDLEVLKRYIHKIKNIETQISLNKPEI